MIVGYQFDRAKVPAIADSSLFSYLNSEQDIVIPNRGTQFEVTTQGLNLLVGTGQAIIQGRLIEVLQTETIAIPPNSTGYLVIKLDLSLVNTSTGVPGTSAYKVINNQLSIGFVNQIINQDIHNGGTIRMFSLGSVSSTATAVTFTRTPNLSHKIIVADNIKLSDDIPWTKITPQGNWTPPSLVAVRLRSSVLSFFLHLNGGFGGNAFTIVTAAQLDSISPNILNLYKASIFAGYALNAPIVAYLGPMVVFLDFTVSGLTIVKTDISGTVVVYQGMVSFDLG